MFCVSPLLQTYCFVCISSTVLYTINICGLVCFCDNLFCVILCLKVLCSCELLLLQLCFCATTLSLFTLLCDVLSIGYILVVQCACTLNYIACMSVYCTGYCSQLYSHFQTRSCERDKNGATHV